MSEASADWGFLLAHNGLITSLGEAECILMRSKKRSPQHCYTEPDHYALRALCLSEARRQLIRLATYTPSLHSLRSFRLGL